MKQLQQQRMENLDAPGLSFTVTIFYDSLYFRNFRTEKVIES